MGKSPSKATNIPRIHKIKEKSLVENKNNDDVVVLKQQDDIKEAVTSNEEKALHQEEDENIELLRAELEKAKAEKFQLQEELNSERQRVQLMKSKGVNVGTVQSIIHHWPGVDYTRRWWDVKWSRKEGASPIALPVNGNFTIRTKDGIIHRYTFKDGRCCTNDFDGMRKLGESQSNFHFSQHKGTAENIDSFGIIEE